MPQLAWWHPRLPTLALLGFAAGLPILLIFSSLSLWLAEAGVARASVTMFSWAALGYSFKFVWAPLVDRLVLPGLGRMGRRRSWLAFAQLNVVAAILAMSAVDPSHAGALPLMALAAVWLGFASATQDIAIDAYRIECAPVQWQAMLSAAYIAGYRVGMVVAGAGALWLADAWGSARGAYAAHAWQQAYQVMAGCMLLGLLTTWLMPEPVVSQDAVPNTNESPRHGPLLLLFAGVVAVFVSAFALLAPWVAMAQGPALSLAAEMLRLAVSVGLGLATGQLLVRWGWVPATLLRQTWLAPVQSFFAEHGARTAWLLLALIGLYRISDIVLGVISNVFYLDMGYSKTDIAQAVKTFGVVVSIAGGFLGGLLATRWGVMRCLFWGAAVSAVTNLLFVWLALSGAEVAGLYAVVTADNLAAGFASAAFVAFLSSLTQVSFTAVQYAVFSSLMTLLPKTLGGYSGGMVDAMGYPWFFAFTAGLGVPVLVLVVWAGKRLK